MIGRRQNAKGFRKSRRVYKLGRASRNFKHGHSENYTQTSAYRTWAVVWQRTTWPKNPRWETYGGSKVQMAIRWRGRHGFETFLADMGKRPKGTTLSRVLDSGNYEPGNCEWATMSQQMAERMGRTAMRAWHRRRSINAETLRDWRGAFRGEGRRFKIKTLSRITKKRGRNHDIRYRNVHAKNSFVCWEPDSTAALDLSSKAASLRASKTVLEGSQQTSCR